MRLCGKVADKSDIADALENLEAVIWFMGEAICGAREVPWERKDDLFGASLIFDALVADIKELGDIMRKPS
jgi:hypothetical protein